MEKKVLGKIDKIDIILEDGKLGLLINFSLDGGKSGITDFTKWNWSYSGVTPGEYHKWTEEDRAKQANETMKFIDKIMDEAKKDSLQKMRYVPVEVTLENNMFKSFRVLTEVL